MIQVARVIGGKRANDPRGTTISVLSLFCGLHSFGSPHHGAPERAKGLHSRLHRHYGVLGNLSGKREQHKKGIGGKLRPNGPEP
jgi:hypothetical protein